MKNPKDQLARRHRRKSVRGEKIRVRFILTEVPPGEQRYDTVGDWIPGSPAEIRVSRMSDPRYSFLVAIHELIEYELCRRRGVTDRQVVAFDRMFEKERVAGLHSQSAEPGDDPRAPYREEHRLAVKIEKLVAKKLDVNWNEYCEEVMSM